MRIGYFVTHFPNNEHQIVDQEQEGLLRHAYTGAVLSAFYLANHMAARGHDVLIFTTAMVPEDSVQHSQNIVIFRYGTLLRVASANMSIGMFCRSLQNEVDIVHAHFSVPPCTLAALWHARRKKRALIITYHGDWADSFGSPIRRIGISLYNRHLLPLVLSSANLITCPTERYTEQSRFLHPYRGKTVTIPNGVLLEDFETREPPPECRRLLELPTDSKLLLYVGSLTDSKGLDVLLDAMPSVLSHMPDTLLILVGDGRLRKSLEAQADQLGIANSVLFAGFTREVTTKARYYGAANLFILPSTLTTESFGMVLLEAMACGVPIVASTIGGIPDVVEDGKEGLLVPPGDVPALAQAITRLLNDDGLRSQMSKNGQVRVRDYSWHRVAQDMEKVYLQVLADG